MLFPGPVLACLAGNKSLDEHLEWIIVVDHLALAVMMVLRNSHVSWIAKNIDHALVARIETIVGSNDAWSWHFRKIPLGHHRRIRDQPINVAPIRNRFRECQVGDEKTSPGISRFRVGNKKCIIRDNEEVTPRTV